MQGVDDEMCEVISLFLENKKKGGGPVEWQNFSKESESLTVRFQEREGLKNSFNPFATADAYMHQHFHCLQ